MNMRRYSLVFGLGLAAALIAGWVVFPLVLYVQRQQPLEFRHKTHAEKSGVADCKECHALREDGVFAGIPAMEKCAGCHSERIGESQAEATLVDNFIKPGHETPWLVYARQPANVWFSHAIHVKRAGLAWAGWHSTYGESDQVRVYEVNRISDTGAIFGDLPCRRCGALRT